MELGGDRWSSAAISGNQRRSVAISGHQRRSGGDAHLRRGAEAAQPALIPEHERRREREHGERRGDAAAEQQHEGEAEGDVAAAARARRERERGLTLAAEAGEARLDLGVGLRGRLQTQQKGEVDDGLSLRVAEGRCKGRCKGRWKGRWKVKWKVWWKVKWKVKWKVSRRSVEGRWKVEGRRKVGKKVGGSSWKVGRWIAWGFFGAASAPSWARDASLAQLQRHQEEIRGAPWRSHLERHQTERAADDEP